MASTFVKRDALTSLVHDAMKNSRTPNMKGNRSMRNSVVAASPDRRRLVRRLSATLAGAALVGASLVAAFPASAASNQELLWGLDSDVPNLQTPMNQGSASMVLNAALHRGLVQYGASGKIVPALAQKFTSKGDQTFVFTMRPKIFFHTGAPVTTADVKATLEWAMDATHAPKLYPATKGIASITTTKTTKVATTEEQ